MEYKRPTKDFDSLEPRPTQTRIGIERATKCDLDLLYPQLEDALSRHLARLDVLERARLQHPDNMWAIHNYRTGTTVGIYAMLMLNADGHRAILAGTLDPLDPDSTLLATPQSETKAIHTWGVYAPGLAAAAIPMIAKKLREPEFRSLDIFGNGTTEAGRRTMRQLGFHPANGNMNSHLFVYRRRPNSSS